MRLGIIYSETRPVKQDADLIILSLDNLIRKYFSLKSRVKTDWTRCNGDSIHLAVSFKHFSGM